VTRDVVLIVVALAYCARFALAGWWDGRKGGFGGRDE
jgi:hypothetical protein